MLKLPSQSLADAAVGRPARAASGCGRALGVRLQSGFVLQDDVPTRSSLSLLPPVGTKGNGTCKRLLPQGPDCNVNPSGYWYNVPSQEACVAMIKSKSCRMATVGTWCSKDKSCTWFNSCDFDHLCLDCSNPGTNPNCPVPKCPTYYPFISEVLRAGPAPPPPTCRDGTACGGTNLWTAWNDSALPNSTCTASWCNPGTMPFPRSTDLVGWEFKSGCNPGYGKAGHGYVATSADTFFPSWGADGNLYTAFTDGCVDDDVTLASACAGSEGKPLLYKVVHGQAVIVGDDPFTLNMTNVSTFAGASAWPYGSRFPSGSLVHNGSWWYGTYYVPKYQDTLVGGLLGPTVDFRRSDDLVVPRGTSHA